MVMFTPDEKYLSKISQKSDPSDREKMLQLAKTCLAGKSISDMTADEDLAAKNYS